MYELWHCLLFDMARNEAESLFFPRALIEDECGQFSQAVKFKLLKASRTSGIL